MKLQCLQCDGVFELVVDEAHPEKSTLLFYYDQYSSYATKIEVKCPMCNHKGIVMDRKPLEGNNENA